MPATCCTPSSTARRCPPSCSTRTTASPTGTGPARRSTSCPRPPWSAPATNGGPSTTPSGRCSPTWCWMTPLTRSAAATAAAAARRRSSRTPGRPPPSFPISAPAPSGSISPPRRCAASTAASSAQWRPCRTSPPRRPTRRSSNTGPTTTRSPAWPTATCSPAGCSRPLSRRSVTAACSPCSSSTWTISSRSTTPWVMTPVTR